MPLMRIADLSRVWITIELPENQAGLLRAGQKVTADQYPYTASSTSLSATVIPDELRSWTKLKAALDEKFLEQVLQGNADS